MVFSIFKPKQLCTYCCIAYMGHDSGNLLTDNSLDI